MSASDLRVVLDATPLAGTRTGIGRYVERLAGALDGRGDIDVRLAAFTVRHRRALRGEPGRLVHRPVPARLLQRAWLRGDRPAAEMVTGRADVVHGTNFVLPPPRRAAGAVTVHDLTFARYPDLVDRATLRYRTLVPRALERAGRVLTPTQAIADEIAADFGVEAARLTVTPLGVDDGWFAAADTPPLPGLPSEYVLAVGTLEPRKGLDVLFAAYRQLLADGDRPPLVLAGGAGWGSRPDASGIPPDRIHATGYLPPAELARAVAHARLLAYPSRYEGFGLPPLEALAAGTPVVAADVPAVREVMAGHARFVPPGAVEALAAALDDVLAHPPDPAATDAGREYARTFTWQRCAALTVSAYRAALTSGS